MAIKHGLSLLLVLLLTLSGCGDQALDTPPEHKLPEDGAVSSSGSQLGQTDNNGTPTIPTAPTEPDEPTWPRAGDKLVTMTSEDMGQGLLILVNNQHFYTIPDDMDERRITIAEGKSASYRLRDYTTSVLPDTVYHLNDLLDAFVAQGGPDDIMVVSGWRSYEIQEQLFKNNVARNGLEHAQRYVAQPKGSEHHTGYAVDLWSVNNNDYLDYTGEYTWITDHCNDYGFILRYEKEKEPVTGIAEETWHYRYLGLPHPWIVTENGFCYEEYIDYLRGFPYDGDHLLYDGPNGTSYEIYFVEGLEVPVPENGNYEISGNNVDGFIVTVTK